MDNRKLVAYHEAGHILISWLVDLPVGVSEITSNGEGRTESPWWRRATMMFREVNQETVRRKVLVLLGGDCGEQLVFPVSKSTVVTLDETFQYTLSKRFCLDLHELREEVGRMVVRQRATIAILAHLLETEGKLDSYRLAILRMDWLARGKSLA